MIFIYIFIFSFRLNAVQPDIKSGLTAQFQAVLLAKSLAFYMNSSPQLTVYIIGDGKDVADELKKAIGQSKIKNVIVDSKLPSENEKDIVIYLVDESKLNEVIKYTRAKRILSVASNPDLVIKGINLGFGVNSSGKSKFILNKKASLPENEHIIWNPSFLNNQITIVFEDGK